MAYYLNPKPMKWSVKYKLKELVDLLKSNPNIYLSGSLALGFSGIDCRRSFTDIDIYVHDADDFKAPEHYKKLELDEGYSDDEDPEEKDYMMETFLASNASNDVKINVFWPQNGKRLKTKRIRIHPENVKQYGLPEYLPVVIPEEIIKLKAAFAMQDHCHSAKKHALDVIYVLMQRV